MISCNDGIIDRFEDAAIIPKDGEEEWFFIIFSIRGCL